MIQLTIVPKKVLVVARAFQGITHLIAPLREAGCWVELATTASEALGRAAVLNPEVVVIEDQMADVNAVELTMQIRSIVSPDHPPTFIMARSSELSDDSLSPPENRPATAYVTRPALVNRIAGLMAPPSTKGEAKSIERLACHGLCLDRVRHRAWIGDRSLHFTPTEFKLLWELVSRPGCVLSRSDLTCVCKGAAAAVQTRTIDAHIKSIRRKLKEYARLIETVHGVGYRFQEMDLESLRREA